MMAVITSVAPDITELGLEPKELSCSPRWTCTRTPRTGRHTQHAEAYGDDVRQAARSGGILRREIDSTDLRRHRLTLTPEGRKTMARGLALLSKAFGVRLARLSLAQQSELATLLEKLS